MAKKNDSSMKPATAKPAVLPTPTPPAPEAPAKAVASAKALIPAKAAVSSKAAPPVAKRSVKTAAKAKPAAKTAKTSAAKPKRAAKSAPSFTREDVALRAYFLSEKRRNQGLPGDEHQDWIEAERQLLMESAGTKKVKKV